MDEQGNPILDKNGKQAYRAVSTTGWSSKEMLIYLRKNWANRCNEKFKEKEYKEIKWCGIKKVDILFSRIS